MIATTARAIAVPPPAPVKASTPLDGRNAAPPTATAIAML
jgi:hypothetical protein